MIRTSFATAVSFIFLASGTTSKESKTADAFSVPPTSPRRVAVGRGTPLGRWTLSPSALRNRDAEGAAPAATLPLSAQLASMMGGEDASRDAHLSFDDMLFVDSRLGSFEREASEILTAFYEPHLKSFSVRPGDASNISVTSTCFALQAIFSTGECAIFDSAVNTNLQLSVAPNDEEKQTRKIPVRDVLKALLLASWREDDMFQVPLLLQTVLKIDSRRSILGPEMDEELSHRVRTLIAATIGSRPKRRNGLNQPCSDYILYLITESLATLVEQNDDSERSDKIGFGGLPTNVLPDGAETLLALARCVEVSYNELCRQLAFRSAGDMANFDIMRLAYSLLTYTKASNAMAGTAGREVVQGQGPQYGTAVRPPNRRLVRAALAAFFAEQTPDGMWEKGQPIYKSFRRTGQDVGNAFVFAADTVGSLLAALPAEEFRPHLDKLEKLLCWIEQHMAVEIIPSYCDVETNQCYGKPLRGWESPHMTSQANSPAAWSTAQTLTCIMRMRKVVQRLLHVDVLEEFGGFTKGDELKFASWNRLLDTDLGDPVDDHRTLKGVLDERMIKPFSMTTDASGNLCNEPKFGAAYSSVLFGPPGSAKTTICEALAERMGWDFVVIDTATFLADGLTNVAARIRYVFNRLICLNNCVILFDEIEEFCLDRETPGLGMESRMLTTAMLTAINDLRRAKKSIFFLATNRLRAFDSAITRPGRFDMQLFVGTPNLESRVIQLRSRLASVAVDPSKKADAEAVFRAFLMSVWTENAMFFNYLEGLQFATVCADVVASGNPLTNDEMAKILNAQAAVMTVRGAGREEYIASMGLSRL